MPTLRSGSLPIMAICGSRSKACDRTIRRSPSQLTVSWLDGVAMPVAAAEALAKGILEQVERLKAESAIQPSTTVQ